jgi:PAS domain S-box-containing protein
MRALPGKITARPSDGGRGGADAPVRDRSLVKRLITLVGIGILAAAVLTAVSLGTATALDGDAAWINAAGRRRMESFRVAYLLSTALRAESEERGAEAREALAVLIPRMEKALAALRDGDAALGIPRSPSGEVRAMVEALLSEWESAAKPSIERLMSLAPGDPSTEGALAEMDGVVSTFVSQVDDVVHREERLSEERVARLRTWQVGFALLVLVLGGMIVRTLLLLRAGLAQITEAAAGLSEGNADLPLPREAEGEVGALARAFQAMRERIGSRTELAARRGAQTRAVLDATADAIVTISTEGIVRSFNRSAERMFGYTPPEVIGRNVRMLMPSPWREEHDAYLERYHRTGVPRIIGSEREVDGLRKDGGKFHLVLRVAEMEFGGERSYIGSMRDVTDEKIRERILAESLDALSAHIAILDDTGEIVAVNEAWRGFGEANGLDPVTGGVGANYLDACHAGDADAGAAAAQQLRELMNRQRDILYLEYPCHGPQEKRWFAMRATRFRGDGPLRIVVAHENITDRKLREIELRESEGRLAAASRVAGLGHWMWDLSSGELWWSDGQFQLFGRDPETFDVSYEGFMECVHPEDRQLIERSIAKTLEKGAPYRVDFRIELPGGGTRVIHMEAEAEYDDDGNLRRVLGASQDVTERKLAEGALRRSEEQYRTLVQHATYGIYQSTPEGRLLQANPAMARILGFDSVDEIIATVWLPDLYVDPNARERVMRDTAGKNAIDGIEVRWRRRGGSVVDVRLAGRIERDESGNATSYSMIAEDVTEHRQLERSLAQSQKLEAIGQLAGGVAHDFNNILTVILGESQLALREMAPDNAYRETLEEIRDAGTRAAAVTRQLLAFSRKQIVEPTVFDLRASVDGLHTMLRRIIGEDILMEVAHHAEPLLVCIDRGQFEQAVTNLVVNARDAMPAGGRLRLETSRMFLDQGMASTDGVAPGDFALLSVTDWGRGMDEETRRRLFEPFFTTKARGRGTGLGLAQVYGIVKKFYGTIHVDSAPGKGARFDVFLPLSGEGDLPSLGEAVRSFDEEASGVERILLVEDDRRLRRTTVRMLTSAGYRVVAAESGMECLKILEDPDQRFDLMVTDVVLPEMGGREIAERVQQIRPEIKILFVSGYTDDVVLQRKLLDRDASFLPKPFTIESLTGKIRAVLDAEE